MSRSKYSNKLRGICLLYSSCASFLKLVDPFFVLEGHFHEIFCVAFDGGKGCLWWFGFYGSCLGCRNGGMNIIYVFFLQDSCTITECLARLQRHLPTPTFPHHPCYIGSDGRVITFSTLTIHCSHKTSRFHRLTSKIMNRPTRWQFHISSTWQLHLERHASYGHWGHYTRSWHLLLQRLVSASAIDPCI